ncbi:2-hydroxyacid dehydrogenase [Flavobacterium alkalisoli]|uniref:2-hydroxyacid dehydrogenase n=1 Tax=Flavobacterium alkalisoli TaxID=2602769 RepID=UPI003A8CDB80
MKIAFFDTHEFEKKLFNELGSKKNLEFSFFETRLNIKTISLAKGHDAICVFTNDKVCREVLEVAKEYGIGIVALRCAGFNNVDLKAAKEFGISVVRVPEYSPYAIAEHSVALLQTLNRKIHRAHNRVREGNFRLDGLLGFDLYGKTVGVIGTGKIGQKFVNIMNGFGCKVIAYDKFENDGINYVPLDKLLRESDIISLHVPLNKETHHIIDEDAILKMKDGVFLINTSRGGLVDSKALINGLKSGKIGAAGLDVYEEEEYYFFEDHSDFIMQDDDLARLLSFPNVLITSHQGFFTREALNSIGDTTISNLMEFFDKKELTNSL